MPGFLSPRKDMPLLLIPDYSGINKGHRFPDRSITSHRNSPVKCFLTVHPKGDQSCVFIGKTDIEAETPILWPPDVKT